MKIDIKQLALKADPIKLMQNPVFKNVPENGKSSIRKLVADPFSTGIDPLENIYGFLAKDGEATISAIVFKVSCWFRLCRLRGTQFCCADGLGWGSGSCFDVLGEL